jgi:hypothetical protein
VVNSTITIVPSAKKIWLKTTLVFGQLPDETAGDCALCHGSRVGIFGLAANATENHLRFTRLAGRCRRRFV